ncbi:MAG: lysine 2,3-aminomutase, partial [Bacteroidetes bacterium 4572_77]
MPFKVNNYVIDELIDWDNYKEDPIYILTFPQKGMLKEMHYRQIKDALKSDMDRLAFNKLANNIRQELNPNPAGQMDHNVPVLNGERLTGVQHKYEQTILFFPSHGQTCHAYCTFCFRWPQFVGNKDLKFARNETQKVVEYLSKHPKVTDVLITGGDPMTMGADRLRAYIEPFLEVEQIKNIRIGTKSLAYWPYKYVNEPDTEAVLQLFRDIKKVGKQVAFMAHINHPKELSTPVVKQAVENILATGTQIRTQSPIMKHINDDSCVWRDMWTKQVEMGMIP